jgi:methylglutaconyl-CoA hydratase
MDSYVKTDINGGVATIEFFHMAHNSMPSSQLIALKENIDVCSADDNVKVIVLKSAGDRSFCSGASFTELASLTNEIDSNNFFMGFANVINSIRTNNKLVIGRVQGKAVGGGVGLAAACDYTFATKHASIRLSELAVGIGPFVIGPAVERKIGLSAFTQMSLTPYDWQTSEWAKEKGLYFETFEDITSMDNRIEKFTSDLLSFHTDAIQNLKKIFWQDTNHWDTLLPERAAISGKLILKDFSQSLIHKFKHH